MFDETDFEILSILQSAARTSNAEIARTVGLTPPAVLERIRKLERAGVIRGYHASLDAEKLGRSLLAFIFVKSEEEVCDQGVSFELAQIPEVLEVHHVAGEDCYLVKVRTSGPRALGRLLRERFGQIPAVSSTRSTVVLETVKEDSRLELATVSDDGEIDEEHADAD